MACAEDWSSSDVNLADSVHVRFGIACWSIVATSLVYPCLDCDLGFDPAPIPTYSKDAWFRRSQDVTCVEISAVSVLD